MHIRRHISWRAPRIWHIKQKSKTAKHRHRWRPKRQMLLLPPLPLPHGAGGAAGSFTSTASSLCIRLLCSLLRLFFSNFAKMASKRILSLDCFSSGRRPFTQVVQGGSCLQSVIHTAATASSAEPRQRPRETLIFGEINQWKDLNHETKAC